MRENASYTEGFDIKFFLDFTKPHGQCIIDTICDQCNGAYQAHVEENPEFEGHVHMIGFSLGGVACYDILSMQWSLEEDGPPPWENVKPDPYVCAKPDVNIPKLEFKVQNLFTCGSPIGKVSLWIMVTAK